MVKTTPLENAIALALEAHRGQVDKGGKPYILHPLRIMMAGKTDAERIAGVLHDVLEDSPITKAALADQFGMEIADAVEALSRRDDEDYPTFIARCRANPLARAVKLNDLADNMDMSRLPEPLTERDEARLEKYRAASAQLG